VPRKVIVAGVGMIPFAKPGASAPYDEMGAAAAASALADAGLAWPEVRQAYVGYVYGDSTAGQKALYRVGMTGLPVVNAKFTDRPTPFDDFDRETDTLVGHPEIPLAIRYFGGAGLSHMKKYGTTMETFAQIRAKASRHAVRNPLALFRKEVTVEEVLASPLLMEGVMTRLMACPPTCGAAAAIVVSQDYARRHALDATVSIAAQAMTTDTPSTFEAHDMMQLVGYDMAKAAAREVYEAAGVGPDDVDVVELHDCFAQNELISYEALGLCPEGGAAKFVADADNTYGGRYVTNPSGGLLSKGHPLGATGLAQCYELVNQLRGTAEERQVEGAQIGLQHNLGLGGACVVTLYQAS
jgi:sterol carrier protein 2